MQTRRFSIFVLVAAAILAVAGTAQAATYELSTKNRYFCCTNPPFFFTGIGANGYHTVVATASVTGTGTPAIKIGMGHAAQFYSMVSTPDDPAISIRTVKATISVSNASGTLQKGGGYGSFSFCPTAVGPGPGACTNPKKASPASFNGRIKVTPGKNKFGGTLQILAGPSGVGGSELFFYRYLNGPMMSPALSVHARQILSPIGAMTPARQRQDTVMSSLILSPAVFYWGGMFLQNGAGPFTTGMVTVQVSKPGVRSVMLTGYDNRTPMGVGNIQVVSGLLANTRHDIAPLGFSKNSAFPYGWRMQIHVIPEPASSLGLAAGALALLGACARRRARSSAGPAR